MVKLGDGITSKSHFPDGEGRVCDVDGMGEVHETIYEKDERERELGFNVESEKSPFFLREVKNTFRVEEISEDQSVVYTGVHIDIAPVFKQLMSGRINNMIQKRADNILSELKTCAEIN